MCCTYTYVDKTVDGEVKTSEYVASITYSNDKAFSYTYDPNGNITSVSDGTYTTSYVYDNLGQLTRENSQKLNKTWTYSYDTAGNILSKSEYAYTVGELGTATSTITYGYTNSNWGDQLTSYNGTAITYDSLGNPLNWTNGKTFTWEGRQLKSVADGTYVYTYEYNADGIRTKTTVTKPADPDYSEVYEYILDDNGNVVQIKLNGTVHATFYYDESGSPIGYTNGQYTFRFIKNLQGDIIRIESVDGSMYADYVYDAWGNATAEYSNLVAAFAIAKYNIFTYRGYIYDTQTGFYYLQSRYYDPEVGRFLNADDTDYLGASGTVLGYNLYAYCENNATNSSDPSGCGPFLAVGVQFVVQWGKVLLGLEALWSTSNGSFYLFGFVGGNKTISKSLIQTYEDSFMYDIVDLLKSVPRFNINNFSLFKKISVSVSFVAVLGNRYAKFPINYCGWFSSFSLSAFHVTASGAYSYSGKIKIGSLGIGVTSSKGNFSFSQTYYVQLSGNNALKNNLRSLKDSISDKLNKIKLLACFF